jgi:hypothetical protein
MTKEKPRFVCEGFESEVSPDEAYAFADKVRVAALEHEPGEPRPFRLTGNENVLCPPERERVAQEMEKIGAGPDETFKRHVLEQAIRTQQQTSWLPGQPLKNVEVAISALTGMSPSDEQEAMLTAQMFGAHNLSMEYLRRSMVGAGSAEQSIMYMNAAAKMLNLHLRQTEALDRRRGRGPTQITVGQQVNVQALGQNYFGAVEAPGVRESEPATSAAPAALPDRSDEGTQVIDVSPPKRKARSRRPV